MPEDYQLVYKVGGEERTIALDLPEIVMGRGPQCQLPLTDNEISRQHAKVFREFMASVGVILESWWRMSRAAPAAR